MSDEIAYVVSVRGDISQPEIDELIQDLKLSAVDVDCPAEKATGIEEIALVVTLVSGGITIMDYSLKGAKICREWLAKQREQGRAVEVELKHPKRKRFDLRLGTEEDLEEWLSR